MIQAFMETQLSPAPMRVVVWENGTIYGEPTHIPQPSALLRRALDALRKEKHTSMRVKYCENAAVVKHDYLSVALPCVVEKTDGVEDMRLIRYSRTVLQRDRSYSKIIFEGLAAWSEST